MNDDQIEDSVAHGEDKLQDPVGDREHRPSDLKARVGDALDRVKVKFEEIKSDVAEGESIGAAGSQGATRTVQNDADPGPTTPTV